MFGFFFKQKTAYEMRISDWSSYVCSSDLILEVTRICQEEAFPGYTAFIANLSAIEALPSNWLAALRAARGIYLLTCPRTKEQYVGSDVLPKALPVITGVRGDRKSTRLNSSH